MSENPCRPSCVNRSAARSSTATGESLTMSLSSADMDSRTFKIDDELSEIYEKRLAEINTEAYGDNNLKEITYREWIHTLRQINKTLISNIHDMERETTERLALMERKASSNCRYSQGSSSSADLCKCRKDISGLIQLVRNGRRCGDWRVEQFNFETITKQDIFGNEASHSEPAIKCEIEQRRQSNSPDSSGRNEKSKLIGNVRALAFEVADKHDEIRDLKKQILSMEDEIQNAQKKIQLKDDVIRELRNDLKALPKCPAAWGPRMSDARSVDSCGMDNNTTPRAGGYHSNRESIHSLNCNLTDIIGEIDIPGEDEEDEREYVTCLKEELTQFFKLKEGYDSKVEEQGRALKDQQDRLSCMVDQLLKSNNDFQCKIKFYRRELLNLDIPLSSRTITDEDSGISSGATDPDTKIVNALRKRFACLNEENYRLKKEEQCLHITLEDAKSKLTSKSELLEQTSKALREVADKLSQVTCEPVVYDTLFDECSDMRNPIVDAVEDLIRALRERDDKIIELQMRTSNTSKINQELECNSKQLETELCQLKQSMYAQNENRLLMQNQDFTSRFVRQAEKYQEEPSGTQQDNNSEYLRIIDDLSCELSTLSRQVNMVQREFLTDEIAQQFESSLKGLETQNDLLQAAVESLVEERDTVERTLKTQNEDLKSKLCKREEENRMLKDKLEELQQRPCGKCAAREQSGCSSPSDRRSMRSVSRADSSEEMRRMEFELRQKGRTVECLKSENAKLSEELIEIRRSQNKQKLLQRRGSIRTADSCNSSEQDTLSKLKSIQETSREQCKSLQKANKEIACLQQEIEQLRTNEEAFSKERELLQAELIALKEKQAVQSGTQKSVQAQLQSTMEELYDAKECLREFMQARDHLEGACREENNRLQACNTNLMKKYNMLVEDYNRIQEEYEKVVEINQEKTKEIRVFNAWRAEQVQIDDDVCRKMQSLEEHIKEMLEDRQHILDMLSKTNDDNRCLLQSLEESRLSCNGTLGSPSRGNTSRCSSNDPVSKVIESVRSTTRRVRQQICVLEEEANRFLPPRK